MKLRAYLVDDEPLALDRLRRLLEETGRVEVTGASTVPEEAVSALKENPPDVCFLDIEMPRLNGFEVLADLAQPPIVKTTMGGWARSASTSNPFSRGHLDVEKADVGRILFERAYGLFGDGAGARDFHVAGLFEQAPQAIERQRFVVDQVGTQFHTRGNTISTKE